tara:strand:- start:88 stop:795 length:708 start_codon:yes stop_codon:yes gene_type:complete
MSFKTILLGVIVVVILYLVWKYVFADNTNQSLSMGGSGKSKTLIPSDSLPGSPSSVDFTFSIWIYVDNWQYKYSKPKVIFRRSNSNSNTLSPSVSLAPSTNDLDISLTTFAKDSASGNVDNWSIQNIPIQKWCSIIISTNNRTVDTYIDGKLVNTHVLSGVPKMDKNSNIELTPDGGFSGATSKFRYFSRTISPREAYEIYREGPGGNALTDLFNKYKLKLSFMKDNEEITGFQI